MQGRTATAIYAVAGLLFAGYAPAQNVVTDWAVIVQPSVNTPPKAPVYQFVLRAMIQIAVYDAVVAIEGGYQPFVATIPRSPNSDIKAAVATAAWRTARLRATAAQVTILDTQYATYLLAIPNSQAKTNGIQVGEASAAAVSALRSNDGFNEVVLYQCSPILLAGEFEPDGGCHTQPVGVNAGQIKPFTFSDPAHFRSDGPIPLTSNAYVEDFIETRDYGSATSSVRTAEQTDIAYFWQAVDVHKGITGLAISRGLNTRDSARFLAMVYTAAADANIAGFEAKYYYRYWRPRTAIRQAATDGNPDTDADPGWIPLISVNHPEYPSAHAYNSTAQTDTIARFFGTNKVTWTLTASASAIPQLVKTERTYKDMNSIMREIYDARVWAGLHWRHSMLDGAQIGRKVAKHVCDNFFGAVP
jgi:hypothetical protein